MAEPNYSLIAAIVIMQDATLHTRSAPVWEQICTYVWSRYRSADDIQPTEPPSDVGGIGAGIYSAFIAAGLTQAVGGVAYALEKIGKLVMTYPYIRGTILQDAAHSDQLEVPTP